MNEEKFCETGKPEVRKVTIYPDGRIETNLGEDELFKLVTFGLLELNDPEKVKSITKDVVAAVLKNMNKMEIVSEIE